MRRILLLCFVIAFLLLPLLVLAQQPTIGQVLIDSATDTDEPQFTVLLAAALEANVLSILDDKDAEVTVFAPTDEAFYAALTEMGIGYQDLTSDTSALISLLTYHVVDGRLTAEDVMAESTLNTLYNDNPITVSAMNDGVFINETAQIIETDIEAGNGIIHVIDAVLMPPQDDTSNSASEIPDDATLADIVSNRDDLTIIWEALEVAGFTSALDQSDTTLTLFLPTDEALEAAGYTIDTLDITQIAYHSIEGEVMRDDLADVDELITQHGERIEVIVTDDGVQLNGETEIIEADIIANNGVIHIINRPLVIPGTVIQSDSTEEATAESTEESGD